MNRESKFRVWDKLAKKMLPDFQFYPYCAENASLNGVLNNNAFNRWAFLQFTGLKDKNGKEIYDGDIIRYDTKLNVIVRFGHRAAWILSDEMNWVDTYLVDHLDKCVIGNIFENPELLKR